MEPRQHPLTVQYVHSSKSKEHEQLLPHAPPLHPWGCLTTYVLVGIPLEKEQPYLVDTPLVE